MLPMQPLSMLMALMPRPAMHHGTAIAAKDLIGESIHPVEIEFHTPAPNNKRPQRTAALHRA